MPQAGGRLHCTYLAQHKGHRERMVEGARCLKLSAKVATGAVDIVTQQQSGSILSCLAQFLHLLGKGHRHLVLGPNHMETPLEIEQRNETIRSIELLCERSRPDKGVGHHWRRIPTRCHQGPPESNLQVELVLHGP